MSREDFEKVGDFRRSNLRRTERKSRTQSDHGLETFAIAHSIEKKISKPERIFAVLAVFFGLFFVFLQPLFVEPDAVYHFDHAMYLANTVVDRNKVGMTKEDYASQPVSFMEVVDMKKAGTYHKNFFETRLDLINKEKVDERTLGTKWYDDLLHLVPAAGVWLGYRLSPTIGSMQQTGRLFSLFFFVISMFFIIQRLKAYKLFFVAVSLTPTVIQTAASLSYDLTNYVLFAWLLMGLINTAVDIKEKESKRFNWQVFLVRIALPSLALYATHIVKFNSLLLYLAVVAILIYFLCNFLSIRIKPWALGLVSVSGIFIVLIIWLVVHMGNLDRVFSKLYFSLIEPYYTVITSQVIGGTSASGVAQWVFVLQVIMLLMILLSYSKKVPLWFANGSLILFFLNLLAVLLSYALGKNYKGELTITGAQGRYFTNFLLLLGPASSIWADKIRLKIPPRFLSGLMFAVTVLALVSNLTITLTRFNMNLPLDEFRSGFEHFIFK